MIDFHINASTTTTLKISPTTTAEVPLSNKYTDKDFNITWFPNDNYVDFFFTADIKSSSVNFWAAFAFSKDTNMVNDILYYSNTIKYNFSYLIQHLI
jgi:ABC-type microcin C transport system permease subunit YejE